jgi:hypothetical protein
MWSELLMAFAAILISLSIATLGAPACLPPARLAVEHMYCEPCEEMPAQLPLTMPSLVAKGRCRGLGCPPLHARQVVLTQCRWPSVNNVPVFVEETSGWFFFYLDEGRTRPLRPTDEEIATIHDGEKGYLRHGGGIIATTECIT